MPLISTVPVKEKKPLAQTEKKIRKYIRDQEKPVVFAEQVRLTQPSRSCLQPTPSLTQQGLCPTLAFCPMHASLWPQYTDTMHTSLYQTHSYFAHKVLQYRGQTLYCSSYPCNACKKQQGKILSLQSEQHLPVGYFALHAPLHDSHSSVVCA